MAMTFPEIEKLIYSKNALPALNKFIEFATILSIGIRTGQMSELPCTQETIIAAVVLQKLMNTKDGRKLLGIKSSNKVYNVKDEALQSPKLEIARRLGCGEITRQEALEELSNVYAQAKIYPVQATLESVLDDLVSEANNLRKKLEIMLKVAGWDGSEDNFSQTLSDIQNGKKQS